MFSVSPKSSDIKSQYLWKELSNFLDFLCRSNFDLGYKLILSFFIRCGWFVQSAPKSKITNCQHLGKEWTGYVNLSACSQTYMEATNWSYQFNWVLSSIPSMLKVFRITNSQCLWKELSDGLVFQHIVRYAWKLQIDLIILNRCVQAFSGMPKVLWNNESLISSLFNFGSCFRIFRISIIVLIAI